MPFGGEHNTCCKCLLRGMVIFFILTAAMPESLAKDKYEQVHSVAILSALGNLIEMQKTGLTRFGYDDYKLQTDWNPDEEIRNLLSKVVERRATVNNEVLDPQIFGNFTVAGDDNPEKTVRNAIRANPKIAEVDALIAVFPDSGTESYFPQGLGITHDNALFSGKGNSVATAKYMVAIFDAKTGEKINYGTGQYPSSNSIFGRSPPMETCSDILWAKTADELTTEQKNAIHAEFSSLLSRSLAYALASANFITKTDAVSAANSMALPAVATCRAP